MMNLEKGQTIFEVLIGLTVVMLFLTGIVMIQLVALKNTNYSTNKSLASTYAREQLERVRVARDTMGLSGLVSNYCNLGASCYVNDYLTPVIGQSSGPTPYQQKVIFSLSPDCPTPAAVPNSVSYKVTAISNWGGGAVNITPAPEVSLSSCLSDWR